MRTLPLLLAVVSAGCLEAKNPHLGLELPADGDVDSDSDSNSGLPVESECNGIEGSQRGDRFRAFEPFELPRCDGSTWTYGGDIGKVVLYNLCAGWCIPCKIETTELLLPFYEEHVDEGFNIVQVVYESEEASAPSSQDCVDWVEEFGMTYTVLFDPGQINRVVFEDGPPSLPVNIVVDREGCVHHRVIGTAEGHDALEAKILEVL